MNIYALPGHKVVVTEKSIRNGIIPDRDKVNKYLEIKKPYHVDYTEIDTFSSRVYLQEFPNVVFSTVMFEDVEKQSPEDDKKHPEWHWYN